MPFIINNFNLRIGNLRIRSYGRSMSGWLCNRLSSGDANHLRSSQQQPQLPRVCGVCGMCVCVWVHVCSAEDRDRLRSATGREWQKDN